MMTDEPVMLDTPEQIQMFALLQCRGRLQLELKGLRFKQSTIQAINRAYGQNLRTRKAALEFIEKTIDEYKAEHFPRVP
jgi:hypothetical protein